MSGMEARTPEDPPASMGGTPDPSARLGGTPDHGVLRSIVDELLRRLEGHPLMGRPASQCTPGEQARLAVLLDHLTRLRHDREMLAGIEDLSLSTLAEAWPELAALLGPPDTAQAMSGAAGQVDATPEERAAPDAFFPPPLALAGYPHGSRSSSASEALPDARSAPLAQSDGALALVPAADALEDHAPHAGSRLSSRFPALGYHNFVFLWTGLIISNAGTQMQAVAVNWLVLSLWHSPLALGVVSLAYAVPMIALPYIGGAVADRVDRLRLLKVTQLGQMSCAAVLTLLATLGVIQVWEIVALSALSAAFLAIDNPTRQALFPDLVARRHLMSAISLQSAAFTGAALFGPALGGILLTPIGPAGIFFLNTISYLAVLSALFQIHGLSPRASSGPRALGPWLREGLAYVWRTRVVLLLLMLSFVGNLLGRSYIPLLAVFARTIFHVGPSGYGLMVAATGLGALAGAIVLAGMGDVRYKGRLCVASAVLFSLALWLFALRPPYPVALALLVLAGVTGTLFSAPIATMLQLRVPRELRGRVMSLYTITLIGVSSLGALGSSIVATAISAPTAYMGAAALFALCAAGAGLRLWWLRDDGTGVAGQPAAAVR